ncbi:NAD(P)H-binding protein [uncultured Anaerococcus sp.]|uniref:NAD(P)H-binding protein n=1 Tax=uncultured Anaerococcus sp. TaxID=293428 RepID=UPI0025E045D0|nr:NAD(P)H-binding protein [uncultured Anaerococcus sp.]
MKILILGANGGVGSKLINILAKNKADFTASVRNEEKLKELKSKGIDSRLIDVVNDSIDDMADIFKGYDKVLFSVGAGGKGGAETTVKVDLDGAVKTMKAAKKAGISQYYMVSTWDSSRTAVKNPEDPIKTYTICKHYADLYLKENSGLSYTIIHPSTLNDGGGEGRIEITDTHSTKVAVDQSISRSDVAEVLAELLLREGFKNAEIQIAAGDTEIDKALDFIK